MWSLRLVFKNLLYLKVRKALHSFPYPFPRPPWLGICLHTKLLASQQGRSNLRKGYYSPHLLAMVAAHWTSPWLCSPADISHLCPQ